MRYQMKEIIFQYIIEKLIKFVENIEKKINEKKISDEIVLRFTKQKENGNSELKNIDCEYINKSLNVKNKDNKKYEDKDILNNNIKNFNDFIESLRPNINESSIKLNSNISYSSQQTTKKILNDISSIGYNSFDGLNYVKVLSQNLAVGGGGEKLYFFDSNYRKVYEISIKNDNIFKIEGIKKNNTMEFVVCSNNNENICLLTIPNNNINNFNDYRIIKIRENIKTRICFQFNKDFILCNEDGLFQINDLTSNITRSEAIYIPNINKSYWTGIKINSELIALTSNRSIVNGEDRIIFYNYYGKRILKDVENYSFSLSQNNLALMPIEGAVKKVKIAEVNKANKILLCACKKYL